MFSRKHRRQEQAAPAKAEAAAAVAVAAAPATTAAPHLLTSYLPIAVLTDSYKTTH